MENIANLPFLSSLTLSSAKASGSSARPNGSKLPPGSGKTQPKAPSMAHLLWITSSSRFLAKVSGSAESPAVSQP
ncbi:hypothetical protein G4B88_031139 [Cannabis sativa]|uniref:Uncharacterized protein n=1 Tax=Cannabis sativa TaxID=3483 RepID=A0A7J6GSU5_CANSA|nr:hypothetical protein G4B88_031139 [Cannabis sativa]